MDYETFIASLSDTTAPPLLSLALQALWYDRKGDWNQAHEIAQDIPGADGSWVHAYLHRQEGDLGNAYYWYRRARQPAFEGSLKEEWEQMVRELLKGF
ncbi:MAG: hypothetical protein HC880_18270 [Bacteroidia bacterium]|nr:hypothetical protein [Bacteroidia bacterium]